MAVREVFVCHSQRYGTRRLRVKVQVEGHAVGRRRIRRELRIHTLHVQKPRLFRPRTTDSDLVVRAAPNCLLDQLVSIDPNQVWVHDITYLPARAVASST